MPTQWAHSFYWRFSDTTVVPVIIGEKGYPAWQSTVTGHTVILFGPPLDWLRFVWRYLVWLVSLLRWGAHIPPKDRAWTLLTLDRLARESPDQRHVLDQAIRSFASPHWARARIVVQETAQTKGFNHPEAWISYNRALKADPGQAENTFRHLRSVHELRKTESSTISNPDAHLLIELAYQAFATRMTTH